MQVAELDKTPAIIEDTWNQTRTDEVLRSFIDEHFTRLDYDEEL